jgi:hypothetical protein
VIKILNPDFLENLCVSSRDAYINGYVLKQEITVQHYYQTVNNILLYSNVILYYITISIISQQREREQVGHTGANNKDYHARKPIYVLGVGFNSNSKWFLNGQYTVCFRIEYLNRIEYFIRTVIVYIYVDSPSQVRRKVRDSTYALRTSKNIRFEFETIFECRKIRKTLKFSNFESNIFSNPTPTTY